MTFRKTIPDTEDRGPFPVGPTGIDLIKPDRLLRRFSWETDPAATWRTGEPCRFKDVHKRFSKPKKAKR